MKDLGGSRATSIEAMRCSSCTLPHLTQTSARVLPRGKKARPWRSGKGRGGEEGRTPGAADNLKKKKKKAEERCGWRTWNGRPGGAASMRRTTAGSHMQLPP